MNRMQKMQTAAEAARKTYEAKMLEMAKASGNPERVRQVEDMIVNWDKMMAKQAATVRTETDLQQMERLLGGPTSGKYKISHRDGEGAILHVGHEGCFVYDAEGNEVDMDF